MNKKVFNKHIPKLNIWLKPLPPTRVTKALLKFRLEFENFSENQQLQIIAQIVIPYGSIKDQSRKIRYVHSCLHKSIYLRKWKLEILKLDQALFFQSFDDRIMGYLHQTLCQLNITQKGNLIVALVQISQPFIMNGMKMMYWTMQDNLSSKHTKAMHSASVLQIEEKNRLILELQQSSLIIQHILLLHQRLEQQMVIYLQHMKNQLNYQIDMELEIQRYFRQ